MIIKQTSCHDKRGSALLLTLLIVSLLLVIVLSFVTFVRIQLREVTNGQNLLVARQNARLGLELAVSELQKYAGADQRVTVPATTVYPEKDFDELYDGDGDEGSSEMFSLYRGNASVSSQRSYLSKVATYTTPNERESWDGDLASWWNNNGRNPHWTGIYNSSLRVDRATDPANPADLPAQSYEQDPATIYGEPKRSQLPVWLISGNEQLNFNPLTDTSYPGDYKTPEIDLGDPDVDGSEAVWMVKYGSATNAVESVDGLDGRVKAPRVEVDQGHYAYWVSDESTKANFAVREPDDYVTAAQDSVEYRNRLQVPQRVGWERMTGFDSVFDANPGMDVNNANFAKVMSQSQIGLVSSDFVEPVKANFHHVTSTSKSLLTDTALGGLKKDLTRYLEDDLGLDDDDPIADPARYDADDPRFATYGGTNSGFPHDSDEALDGVPTWGQVRSWYQNEATGSGAGSIDPDVESGATPVLTAFHLQNGLSYDGTTKMLRMHWAPMVVLWNPYDVSLNSATYNLEFGIMPTMSNLLICRPEMASSSKLSDRAALDPDADWQSWTVTAGNFLDPNGKPLLEASSDSSDGTVTVSDVNSPGTYEIFRVYFHPTGTLQPPDGDTSNRYMVKLSGDPDAFNTAAGPYVHGDWNADVTSDAFGRIFYGTEAGQTSKMYHNRVSSNGPLYGKKVVTDVNPFDSQWGPAVNTLPVERPFPLRLTTDFAPGEVKVFTLAASMEWTLSNTINLQNGYDYDFPPFCWTNFLELPGGPSSAESAGLRWITYIRANSPAYAKSSPSVKMFLGDAGDDDNLFFETEAFGSIGGFEDALEGEDMQGLHPFDYYSSDSADVNAGNGDKDGDGKWNSDEGQPKFVHLWRPIYDFVNFDAHVKTQTARDSDASNWSFGEAYLAPFRNVSTLSDRHLSAIHNHFPVFARYNLGAESYTSHPLTEQTRGLHAVNDRHPDVNGGSSGAGLTQTSYQQGSALIAWDSNQVVGGDHGFVLTARADDGTGAIQGLSEVAIRNAKRADSEILSLGQLQQINLSPYFWQPAFPIGNSDASPYADREGIAGIHSRVMGYDQYSPHLLADVRPNHAAPRSGKSIPNIEALVRSGYTPIMEDGAILFNGGRKKRSYMGGNTMLDLSYVLNENIWDRYFLSTLNSVPSDLGDPLPNARIRFNDEASSASNSELLNFDETAAYLQTKGALNVNSTSVEAWKALLTSFRGLKLDSGSEENPDETAPVTRTLTPINDPVTFDFAASDDIDMGAESTQKDYSQVLSGFRYLDDAMIEALAERIVDEVRLRGPFYSLSDFVNRRLTPPSGSNVRGSDWYVARTNGNGGNWIDADYDPFPGLQGLNGTLQRALNLSGINGGVNHPDLGDDGSGTGNRYDMVYSLRIKNSTHTYIPYNSSGIGKSANQDRGSTASGSGYKHSVDPAMKSHLDSEHAAGSPVGEAGQLLQGAPGFVTQGDLLAMIGPALTARGDTFKIRAYGDSSGVGDADARAWLEAVVQRIPEPVTPDSSDEWRPTDSFGRRFKVVSVRWLTPEEI